MSKASDKITVLMKDFEKTPECHGMALRLDVAAIIFREFKNRGWTSRQYAKRAGFTDVHICRILHSRINLNTLSIAKLMHPFGIRLRLVKVRKT